MVVAPNAFKGSLTAAEAALAMAEGVRQAGGEADVVPVADGGDGTLEVLLSASRDARRHVVEVTGPLGEPAQARLGTVGDTALVELAEASGLRLLRGRRDPLGATTRGTGELIAAGLERGARRIVVGVGGSASTDGGAGALAALGARLLDAGGNELPDGGGALRRLAAVDLVAARARVAGVTVEVAVDVRSPLLGPAGAAAVFGPQKGAGPREVEILEEGLARLAALLEEAGADPALRHLPGAGAAGGCAYGLAAGLGAAIVPGAPLVCDLVDLDDHLAGAALVVTGEGCLDAQTAAGKAPAEVLARSLRAGVPCAAVAGRVDHPPAGFIAVAEASAGVEPGEAMRRAAGLVREATRALVVSLLGTAGAAPASAQ